MAFDRIACPKCDKTFGQEAKFLDHVVDFHGVGDTTQLYVDLHHGGTWPTCSCRQGCLEKLTFVSWKKGFLSKYVRGHNARVDSVYLDPSRQTEFLQKRVSGYSEGRYKVWNDGLTKESSSKLSEMAKKTSLTMSAQKEAGTYVDWRKAYPEKAAVAKRKAFETKKRKFDSGELVAWNKGLTKETDPRVAAMSSGIVQNYQENPGASSKRLTPEDFVERVSKIEGFSLVSDPSTYKNKYQRMQFRCVECGSLQEKTLTMIESTPLCFSCHPKESTGQLEVLEFVRSLGFNPVSNERAVLSPLEIDVWVHELNLGIEYNGLYWHSTAVTSDPKKHQTKHSAAVSAGINLLSVYEDEWRDKRKIVEGMIRHRLRKPLEVLDARKMTVKCLDPKAAAAFFDSSHLEGSTRGVVAFGLVDRSGRIVAASSLRRPFHKRHSHSLEVARSATLPGVVVRGWLGKLTPHLVGYAAASGMKSIMTYVDSRVGAGAGYMSSGWKLEKESTGIRFWWTDFHRRYNRFKYKADKSRGMTQAQVAAEAGVVEIYGCANSLWRIDIP